jgi:hypothetical protein
MSGTSFSEAIPLLELAILTVTATHHELLTCQTTPHELQIVASGLPSLHCKRHLLGISTLSVGNSLHVLVLSLLPGIQSFIHLLITWP